ncbi:hypothetical protein PG999_000457 [Apiospora kogelbergensis]|uniref:Ankyrin repeat-containing protein n=1 Tax=Apiospora kogelbergensis TaxID=1337665 RepID=A0AAW0RBV8_9PEZI
MDGFINMPPEIVRLIAIEAVKARRVNRAVRLRLVNRSWNREITEAMIESGILDGHPRVAYSCFWPRLLMHKLRRADNRASRELRLIRRVAQRVVAIRTAKPVSENHEAVQDCLWELCQLSPDANVSMLWYQGLFTPDKRMAPIRDSDEDFQETLLAAAAATNDVALVQKLYATIRDCPCLVDRHEAASFEPPRPIFGYPLDIAAFKGHVEVLRTLLGIIHPKRLYCARRYGIQFGSAGNQMGSIDICLRPFEYICVPPAYRGYQDFLIATLRCTMRIPIFDRIYQVCKDYLVQYTWPWPTTRAERRAQTQGEFLSAHFCRAAICGELAMMKHLVQLGARLEYTNQLVDDSKYGYKALVSCVAAGGHADVLTYLLRNGAQTGSRSLEAACRYGNPDVVRILLDHGAEDSFEVGNALIESIKGEHETALRLLLEMGTIADEDQLSQALDVAENEDLSSMTKILREYK